MKRSSASLSKAVQFSLGSEISARYSNPEFKTEALQNFHKHTEDGRLLIRHPHDCLLLRGLLDKILKLVREEIPVPARLEFGEVRMSPTRSLKPL